MQTSYIYSVSRVNALSQSLLSKTDIERLLVADPGEDLKSALKETYLAPYLVQVPNENLPDAIERTLTDAKSLIHRIAPNGDMFRVLWVQYDIHNLRVFAKATLKGMSYEDCASLVSERGIYDSEYLHASIEAGTLDSLQSGWQGAYEKAVQAVAAGDISGVDSILDEAFFATCKQIVGNCKDAFVKSYLANLIDLQNLKVNLRLLNNESVKFKPNFISGGNLGEEKFETEESILQAFANFGGADFWKDSIEYFQKSRNTTSLDARAEEFMVMTAKEASYDMFSSGSLVLYYLRCRQAAGNVRTIVVGKNSGMKESIIRNNLRMAYVND